MTYQQVERLIETIKLEVAERKVFEKMVVSDAPTDQREAGAKAFIAARARTEDVLSDLRAEVAVQMAVEAADLCRNVECNRLVTVCKSCKMASCWRGLFMCDSAKGADVEQLPVWRLRDLNLEHSDYYAASDDYPEPGPESFNTR